MTIESGYWNYYMSFRVTDYKKVFEKMIINNNSESVIGVALDNEILGHSGLSGYFQERKDKMFPLLQKRDSEQWDSETEGELYCENKLPEYYFDFVEEDGSYIDRLECVCREDIAEIHKDNESFIHITNNVNKESWSIMALMPLKVELKPLDYEYCPVYVYLFENGYGVIKTSIRLDEVEGDVVSSYPMGTWFGDVKAWEPLMNAGAGNGYKIYKESSGEQDISIITFILQQYVYGLFGESLLDERRFSCFETFVIAKMKGKQLWEINNKGSIHEKEALYHFANPEDFMAQITSERWHEFWNLSYLYFNGFDIIKGHNCRLILSIDAQQLENQFHREDIEDKGSYLNISIQRSFDLFLVMALCEKDGELYLYRASEWNVHNIDKQMAVYNRNRNFFESFLDVVPYNARKFYSVIREINDYSFVDVGVRVERIKDIESYQRNLLLEKRELLLEVVALIGSILFGLPMLHETMTILRETLLPEGDLIAGEVVQTLAVVIWAVIILLISLYLLRAYKQYQKRKIG